MQCPLRDGAVVTMVLRMPPPATGGGGITAEGPNSTSDNLPLCVQLSGSPPCSLHVATTHAGLTNSDPTC